MQIKATLFIKVWEGWSFWLYIIYKLYVLGERGYKNIMKKYNEVNLVKEREKQLKGEIPDGMNSYL